MSGTPSASMASPSRFGSPPILSPSVSRPTPHGPNRLCAASGDSDGNGFATTTTMRVSALELKPGHDALGTNENAGTRPARRRTAAPSSDAHRFRAMHADGLGGAKAEINAEAGTERTPVIDHDDYGFPRARVRHVSWVPNGSVGWAAVLPCGSNGWPLAVRWPCQ